MTRWEYKRAYLYNSPENVDEPWEYCVPYEERDKWLNERGAEGWELVEYELGDEWTLTIFKRPLAMLADNEYIAHE